MRCAGSGFTVVVFALLFCGGCGGTTISEVTSPNAPKCQPELAGVPASVPFSGTTVSATVSTTRDCAWNITTDGSWVEITPNAGQGDASINIVVAGNSTTIRRSATISINNIATTISEDAAPPPPAPGPTPGPAPNPNPPPPSPQPTPISFRATVTNLAGTCPALTFTAAGHLVRTDSQTQFRKGTCGDVQNGVDVVIDGELLPGGVVQATTIQLKSN